MGKQLVQRPIAGTDEYLVIVFDGDGLRQNVRAFEKVPKEKLEEVSERMRAEHMGKLSTPQVSSGLKGSTSHKAPTPAPKGQKEE